MSIDINSLTIGQAKELVSLFSSNTQRSSLHRRNIGKYVIVRSSNEGINAGFVVDADETGIVLKEARRIWYHRPADQTAWYEGVANSGLRNDSKISAPVLEKVIIEDYSITICSAKAEKSIREFESHEQD
jgi:hypothetical protein